MEKMRFRGWTGWTTSNRAKSIEVCTKNMSVFCSVLDRMFTSTIWYSRLSRLYVTLRTVCVRACPVCRCGVKETLFVSTNLSLERLHQAAARSSNDKPEVQKMRNFWKTTFKLEWLVTWRRNGKPFKGEKGRSEEIWWSWNIFHCSFPTKSLHVAVVA